MSVGAFSRVTHNFVLKRLQSQSTLLYTMPHRADDHLFFWKPTEKNGFASQWYKSPFTESSDAANTTTTASTVHFPTAEHYMMYHKALLFKDPEIADQILSSTNPAAVKKLGQRVHNFDEDEWKAHRFDIVLQGNLLKFTQNPDLKALLLATGDKFLVEASPSDKIWGIGKKEADALANKDQWGLNLLGEALVSVRNQLRATEPGQESTKDGEETVA